MARHEMHSSDVAIEQKPTLGDDPSEYGGEIIFAQKVIEKDYADELAFNEEPVTIRLEPSSDENAPTSFPVWCNGKGAEVFQQGRWDEIGYLPMGKVLVVKRKVVAIIANAKLDKIRTEITDQESERPNNRVRRMTSAAGVFSVLHDPNPRGPAWLTELIRRNM